MAAIHEPSSFDHDKDASFCNLDSGGLWTTYNRRRCAIGRKKGRPIGRPRSQHQSSVIFLGFTFSDLGSVTVNIPSSTRAVIFSVSIEGSNS